MNLKETSDFANKCIVGCLGTEELVYTTRFFLGILQRKMPDHMIKIEDYEFNLRRLDWDYVRLSIFFIATVGAVLYRKGNFYTVKTTKEDVKELLQKSDMELIESIKKFIKISDEEFTIATIPPKKPGRAISEESLFIKGVIEDMLMTSEDKDTIFSSSLIAKKITDTTATRVDNILKILVKEGKMEKVRGGYKAV